MSQAGFAPFFCQLEAAPPCPSRAIEQKHLLWSLLLLIVLIGSIYLERFRVPVILIALCAGMLFGSDILGLFPLDDILLTNHVANLALVFILFHGGFSSRVSDLRTYALPALGLATCGGGAHGVVHLRGALLSFRLGL